MNLADQLEKLHTLREQGALTEEEFTLAKKRLIDGSESASSRQAGRAASALDRFRRSMQDKWIGGVCGGLAESTQVPSWAWRIFFLLTILLNGLGLLVYLLLWIFVPGGSHEPNAVRNGSSS